MRAGELCALKLEHIDGERLQIKIRKGKGAKDRYIHVPVELIEYLRLYYQKYRPQVFLFNGREKRPRSRANAMYKNSKISDF